MPRVVLFGIVAVVSALSLPLSGVTGGADKPKVGCWNNTFPDEQGTQHPQFYVAPHNCLILKRGAISFAGGSAAGAHLKWRWGNRVARARGSVYVSSAGLQRHSRLKLTKPVVSCGHLVFSKVLARINPNVAGVDNYHYSFHIYTC